ncbi:hypothetical protein ACQPU1_03010 [Clostridium paraputrificum]|uniref:hypothetical protein n=1 Tax=Clostridium TaxID=1485 RepID=UPI003D3511DA
MKVLKIISVMIIFFTVGIGMIKINIINTRALSPLGNTKDNYEMVNEEFGEDFSRFIRDNSPVKIYVDKSTETLVRVGDKDFRIKDESELVSGVKFVFSKVGNFFVGIKEGIDDITTEINNR